VGDEKLSGNSFKAINLCIAIAKASIQVPIPLNKMESEITTEHADKVSAHEIWYDAKDKRSGTYKIYVAPFESGTPEQWLEHQAELKLIQKGNNLTDGTARFCLACSLLAGEALHIFNTKADLLDDKTVKNYKTCLQAVTVHIFPKQVLRRQKCYMHRFL
jgi:hypothetical protein